MFVSQTIMQLKMRAHTHTLAHYVRFGMFHHHERFVCFANNFSYVTNWLVVVANFSVCFFLLVDTSSLSYVVAKHRSTELADVHYII